ncbi:MAG: 2,3-bisphosphoglycerate-independent phosphoglycerate mutase [Helicobacteraceae bacterium]|jgi:2,3-bisphosphoglycerate-independent phosphoglycerate mutase|nr:2,3-bisphosphoglycerate-independent phosphoglycerate mutase [Helicobacteraceae bacterium]
MATRKKIHKTILIVTDGIGRKPKSPYNAFENATKPTYDRLFATLPHSLLKTHSEAVGLPSGQMGNSEVGHLTLGSGRILYQDLVKISKAIDEGTFGQNKVFHDLLEKSERIHLIGLISDGGVHSHIDHILGVARVAEEADKTVFLHLLTDGRDVSPTSSPLYLNDVKPILSDRVILASVGGRYYGMDRDNRWERVKRAYDAIVLGTPKATTSDLEQYCSDRHAQGVTDEFIEPIAAPTYEGVQDGDAVLFLNFRSDRMRELAQLIGEVDFTPIEVEKREVFVATMTEYSQAFDFPILFPKDNLKNTLCEVIAKSRLKQFHTAETEKYAHVTFFFNGGNETPLKGETRVLIPSPKVATYDLQPEMSADEVGDAVVKAISDGFDFIVVNFANGDMVGHTGNYEAALKAVEAVDRNLGKIIEQADKKNYAYVITSDHGNCEEMKDAYGNALTNHTVGDAWCFVKAEGVKSIKNGGLSNVAATILKIMGLQIPAEMAKPLF